MGTATRYWKMLQDEDKEKARLKAETAAIALTGYPPNPIPYGPGDSK
jgi:hypothetical protein